MFINIEVEPEVVKRGMYYVVILSIGGHMYFESPKMTKNEAYAVINNLMDRDEKLKVTRCKN